MAKLNSKKQKKSLFYKEKSLVGLTPAYDTHLFCFVEGQKRKSSTSSKTEKSPAAKSSRPEPLPAPSTPLRPKDDSKVEEDHHNGDFAVYVTRRLVKSLPD